MSFTKNKAKQNFILLAKILLVVWCCSYIFKKIKQEQSGFYTAFEGVLDHPFWFIVGIGLAILVLSLLNWYFEILKWKILVSEIQKITFKTAALQSLIAHSVAVFTPNRIGDYGAKILFFKSENHHRILGLNAINNIAQMAATILFGILGFLMLNLPTSELFSFSQLTFVGCFLCSCLILLLILKHFFTKTMQRFQRNLKLVRQKQIQVIACSVARYLLFSHQYFLLGWALGWNLDYATAMPCIFVVYFAASLLPSIFILDSALKAGIGVYLFSLFGVPSPVIVAIASVMWLFNFAFPAVVGSVMMLHVKYSPPFLPTQIHTDSCGS